jgi:2-polyprenyl-3-methyl-5-hydroxy-6-metoxy-1,4-benzoquinol methylase
LKDERILDSWQHNAAAWSDAVREKRIESRRAGTDAAIVDAVVALGAKRVLDAGCGEGWLARALSERNMDVLGFDGSGPLIERAISAGGAFERMTYEEFVADPLRLGPDFDVVIFNFSLFSAEITDVLRAASCTLRPGGALLIQTIHPFNDVGSERYEDGWREETFASMGSGFETSMPWYFRTVESWTKSVTDAGYTLTRIREPTNPGTGKVLSLIIEGTI